ncbi:hypothetical protein K470DRAFT_156699 [Piedraia hortae CBS 480.64]|uniref:DNA replication factor Dna2 N-terminal domain-containing protein n=1 Tax=Piedraia hortae CBS 480.64 TaxID=1314780 RepID=A0A6A7BRI0_9PEZI|nr:hypothetical protein K470DRAFT_156699 [Piedraia hortae CBS 480.64]
MANRTKSFFDQDHSAKQRPISWRRPTNVSSTPLAELNPNTSSSFAPIPATSQAISKLKAFRFGSAPANMQQKDAPSNEKALVQSVQDDADKLILRTPVKPVLQPRSNKTPKLTHSHAFPCTPSAKLPLEDLIGEFDEPQTQEPRTKCTPEEQVGWIPQSSSAALTPSRKRKRAKSSSPLCPPSLSQWQEAPPNEKKTPDADPTARLWKSYGADGVNIANLQGDSPKPIETPLKGTGFRRWASAGNDWPSSSKRPMLSGRCSEPGRESKLAGMVEKIQKSLASQRTVPEPTVKFNAPSSSNPLPLRGANSASLPQIGLFKAKTEALHTEAEETLETNTQPELQQVQWTASAPFQLQNKVPMPAYKRPATFKSVNESGPVKQDPPDPAPCEDPDELDDFDFAVEDLEPLALQTQKKQEPVTDQAAQQSVGQRDPQPSMNSNDTEYGDLDLDGNDLQVQEKTPAVPTQGVAPIQTSIGTATDHDNDEEFGDSDIDEDAWVQAESKAIEAYRIPCPEQALRLRRFQVKQVSDGFYIAAEGRSRSQRELLAIEEPTQKKVTILLQGSWAQTNVTDGNIVHVAHAYNGTFSSTDLRIVITDDDSSPFLIVHPDHMLSATIVADSFDCFRKAVLQDRIKATGETSMATVYGQILHEIFQRAMSVNRWNAKYLNDLVLKVVADHLEGLWELAKRLGQHLYRREPFI